MFLLNNFSPLKKAAIFNWWQKMHISKNSPTKISKLKQINISEKQVDSKQTENFNYIKISEVWHLTLKLSCRIKKKHGRRLKQFLTHRSINGSTWLLVHWWFGIYACSVLYLAVHFKIAVFPNIDSVYRTDFRRRILLSTIVSDSFNSKELWFIFCPFSGARLCSNSQLPLDCWKIFRNYQVAVTQMKQCFESLLHSMNSIFLAEKFN